LLARCLAPGLSAIGMPVDILPLALIRPFSGSAANGILADIIHTHGGNAYIRTLLARLWVALKLTFYVIAVYFGAISIRRTRHAVPTGLSQISWNFCFDYYLSLFINLLEIFYVFDLSTL